MNTITRTFAIAALAVALLFAVACNTNQAVTTVEAVVAASEAVVSALPNIPAPVKTEVTTYLGQVSTAVSCTNAELATTDTGTVRGLKIAACFASVNVSSVSPAAQGYVAAVDAAVQALLAVFQSPAAKASTATLNTSARAKVATIQVRNSIVASKVSK